MSDDWDFYFANVNDELASLFVDLGIRDAVPDTLRPHLTWCWVYMNSPRPDGLSSHDEAPALGAIEDDFLSSIKESAVLVGRITTAGRREFYFYGDNPSRCEEAISRAMQKHAAYRFDLDSQRDESWSQYLNVLYPSPEDMQRIQNRRVVATLEEHGDQHTKARPIFHWVYFATLEDRGGFIVEVKRRGFTIADVHTEGVDQSPNPYGVSLERVDTVDQIDDVTIELFQLARLHHGEYDGWETSVESVQ